jgi:hypothetical protein
VLGLGLPECQFLLQDVDSIPQFLDACLKLQALDPCAFGLKARSAQVGPDLDQVLNREIFQQLLPVSDFHQLAHVPSLFLRPVEA